MRVLLFFGLVACGTLFRLLMALLLAASDSSDSAGQVEVSERVTDRVRASEGSQERASAGPPTRVRPAAVSRRERSAYTTDLARASVVQEAAARKVFRGYDEPVPFQKMFGPFVVRPLGLPQRSFVKTLETRFPPRHMWTEDFVSMSHRIVALNRGCPNPLEGIPFEVISYVSLSVSDGKGALETTVGPVAGWSEIAGDTLLKTLAWQAGVAVTSLHPTVLSEFEKARIRWKDAKELHRRGFWNRVFPVVLRKLERGEHERDVVAFYSWIGKDHRKRAVVIRRGDDSVLDRLVTELSALEQRVLSEIAAAVR